MEESPILCPEPGDLVTPMDGSLFIIAQGGWSIYEDPRSESPVGIFAPGTYGVIIEIVDFEMRNGISTKMDAKIICPGGIGWIWTENIRTIQRHNK